MTHIQALLIYNCFAGFRNNWCHSSQHFIMC